MSEFNIYLTKENLQEIKRELEHLERVERPKAIEEVTIARGHGDLSENFEFTAAKEELRKINQRISELKKIIIYAQTITQIATDSVDIGTRFIATVIRDGAVDTKMYELVGYVDLNMISEVIEDSTKPRLVTVSSPFGKAIRDKKVGDVYSYIDAERKLVTGEIIEIMNELEIQPTTDKTFKK